MEIGIGEGGDRMTALADTLRRAAAFLDALPADLPEPTMSVDDDQSFCLEWYRTIVRNVTLWVKRGDEQLRVVWVAGNDEEGERVFTFDGVTVPPEVVAAIRRVIGGGE
jgi:hypothetical protein